MSMSMSMSHQHAMTELQRDLELERQPQKAVQKARELPPPASGPHRGCKRAWPQWR
jgi:hypothetical protein